MNKLFRRAVYAFANRMSVVLQNAQRSRMGERFKSCGQNVTFCLPLFIGGAENIVVGDNVLINAFVHIWGQGGLRIGNRVMIASHTAITTLTHDYRAKDMQRAVIEGAVVIEEDVWIGTHCAILPGVTIGKGAVLGAGSVITRNVEPYAIVAGVPARLLKYRAGFGAMPEIPSARLDGPSRNEMVNE